MIVANLVAASLMQSAVEKDASHRRDEGAAARRRTLVRWMSGQWEAGTDDALAEESLEPLKEAAWSEGVVVLVGDRLARVPGVPAAVRELCLDWSRGQAAAELGRRARLQAVLARLEEAGIPTLVLKGAALAQWLYPRPSLREFSDVDLLFANRADAERAGDALAALGYAMPYRAGRFRHELLCRSADGRLDLDLHWRLIEWPALDALPDFDALWSGRIPLPGLGEAAFGLGAPHALLHACVHRASNLTAGLGDRLKWLYDLHLLAEALDASAAWGRFVEVARRAQACGICAEGLAASAGLFGTVVPEDVTWALEQGRGAEPVDARRLQDWGYVQRMNFRALRGWGEKAAWLGSRLVPPAGHMRELYGDRYGRAGLLWQRLRRAVMRVIGSRP